MTEKEFENGYWYASELKEFARQIGIAHASKLRKDEIEKSIRHYLKTKKVKLLTKRELNKSGAKDIEIGLTLELPVENYTDNKITKEFIISEAKKIFPCIKEKPGSKY